MSRLLSLLRAAGLGLGGLRPWAEAVSLASESSEPFETQTEWAVDATSGDDNAGGTEATPLKTLEELARRWARVFGPGIPLVTVLVRGTFTSNVALRPTFSDRSTAVVVRGEMTTLHSGVVGAFTAEDPATNTRSKLVETGVDLSGYVGKRVRIVAGTAAGAVAFAAEASGQDVYTSHFMKFDPVNGASSVNPVPGDSFVVEDFSTVVDGYRILSLGGRVFALRDLKFSCASKTSTMEVNPNAGYAAVFGCEYAPSVTLILSGAHGLNCCQLSSGNVSFIGASYMRQVSCCCRTPVFMDDGVYVAAAYNVHQGSTATLSVGTGATLEDLGHRGFFGVGGTYGFQLQSVGRYFQLHTADIVWGTGNTCTYPFRVEGGSMAAVLGTQVATSTSGKNALVGGVEKLWAQLPYIDIGAGTNNTAAMVVLRT